MSENILSVTDENFAAEVLKADQPVLVDFWATWCHPCRMIAPLVEQVASEHAGKLKVVKVDVDNAPETAVDYGIRGVPTLVIFKEGELVGTQVGVRNKAELDDFIAAHV